MASKTVPISHWCAPEETRADVRISSIGTRADNDPRLTDRIVLSIYAGAATISLRPTAAEARELIAALQWALEPAEQMTGEVTA